MPRHESFERRLLGNSVLDPEGSGCWLWIGRRAPKGYGKLNVRLDGRHRTLWAHRAAYEVFVGPIPDGMTVDHTCECESCINPAHLELCSAVENTRRRDERARRASYWGRPAVAYAEVA